MLYSFFCSGGESIHREFKNLHRPNGGLNDPVKRLKAIMKRHHLNIYPKILNKKLRPTTKKRGPYKKKQRKNAD